MAALSLPSAVLLDPLTQVPRAIERRRWATPLVLFTVCGVLAGAAFALRFDPAPGVYAEVDQGEGARPTEREVIEKIETAGRVKLVGAVAGALFGSPFLVLLIAVGLKLTAWLLDRKVLFAEIFTASAVAMFPLTLGRLLFALVAWSRSGLAEIDRATVLPSSLLALWPKLGPSLAALAGAVDFFSLWTVVLLGLGFSEAARLPRLKGVVLVLGLYVLSMGVVGVGVPSLAGGGQ